MKKILIAVLAFIVIFLALFGIKKIYDIKYPKNNEVNVVFTTDVNYKDYLLVTLNSAVKNKKPQSVYNIYILSVEMNEKQTQDFKKFNSDKVHIFIKPLKLESIKDVGNFKVQYHVTRADLFKFFMPDIFPELDKILYIDVDTIIQKDLLEIYNVNLGNKYIGVVYKCSPKYIWKKILWHWYPKKKYSYNCGVILYNLKKWRKDNITQELIKAKNKDKIRKLMTQTAFNSALSGKKVYHLPPYYNYLTQWNDEMFKIYDFKHLYRPYMRKINSADELFRRAVIIHYADSHKPWRNKTAPHRNEWFKYKEQ